MAHTLRVIINGETVDLVANEDIDGDGLPDSATIVYDGFTYRWTDMDGDGVPEVITVVRPDESRRVLARQPGSNQFMVLSDSEAPDDSIEEGASHWFAQAAPHTCGPAAITMVLADMFDLRLPNEHQVWERANQMGAMTPLGMPAKDLERVISSYGIPSRTVQSTIAELNNLLMLGHEVILMVDAHDYWPGVKGPGEAAVVRKMPHAVRLLAIDVDAGIAVLSDSGRPNPFFSRLEVPLDALITAWRDLDYLAVVTDVTQEEVRQQLHAEEANRVDAARAAAIRRPHQTIFLPLAVQLKRLARAIQRRAAGGPADS